MGFFAATRMSSDRNFLTEVTAPDIKICANVNRKTNDRTTVLTLRHLW